MTKGQDVEYMPNLLVDTGEIQRILDGDLPEAPVSPGPMGLRPVLCMWCETTCGGKCLRLRVAALDDATHDALVDARARAEVAEAEAARLRTEAEAVQERLVQAAELAGQKKVEAEQAAAVLAAERASAAKQAKADAAAVRTATARTTELEAEVEQVRAEAGKSRFGFGARRPRAERLVEAAEQAATLRAHQVDPSVIALGVERTRRLINVLVWTSIVLGLAFTAVNVQRFAAGSATPGDPAWWSAWVLDPMVSLIVIATVAAEQVTSRYQVPVNGWWVRAAKFGAVAVTYAMNTWESFQIAANLGFGWTTVAPILLHSVPPLLVLLVAEIAPVLRDRLTEAVKVAMGQALASGNTVPAGPVGEPTASPVVSPRRAQDGPIGEPTVSSGRAHGGPEGGPTRGPTVSPRQDASEPTGEPVNGPMGEPTEPVSRPVPTSVEGVPNDAAARWIGNQINKTGKRPSPALVAEKYGVSPTTAKRWTKAVDDAMGEPTTTD